MSTPKAMTKLSQADQRKLLASDNKALLLQLMHYPAIDPQVQLEMVKLLDSDDVIELIDNPSLTDKTIEALCEMEDGVAAVGFAGREGLSPDLQRKLVKRDIPEATAYLAENPSLIEELYEFMANHEDEEVVASFASNESLPVKYRDMFLKHVSSEVRAGLASNAALDKKHQITLLKDSDEEIRKSLAMNTGLDGEVQRLLFSISQDQDVFKLLAGNPNVSLEVQEMLSGLEDPEVNEILANNSRGSKERKQENETSKAETDPSQYN